MRSGLGGLIGFKLQLRAVPGSRVPLSVRYIMFHKTYLMLERNVMTGA